MHYLTARIQYVNRDCTCFECEMPEFISWIFWQNFDSFSRN